MKTIDIKPRILLWNGFNIYLYCSECDVDHENAIQFP